MPHNPITLPAEEPYVGRYHLTQILLPALRKAKNPRVVMMTAKVDLAAKVDTSLFPDFPTFDYWKMNDFVHLANHYYAAHLAKTEPGFLIGVANAGASKTGILRYSPWYMKAFAAIAGSFYYNSIEESAHNPVQACLHDDWPAATYWIKPGDFENRTPIVLDESVTHRIMEISRKLTGV